MRLVVYLEYHTIHTQCMLQINNVPTHILQCVRKKYKEYNQLKYILGFFNQNKNVDILSTVKNTGYLFPS